MRSAVGFYGIQLVFQKWQLLSFSARLGESSFGIQLKFQKHLPLSIFYARSALELSWKSLNFKKRLKVASTTEGLWLGLPPPLCCSLVGGELRLEGKPRVSNLQLRRNHFCALQTDPKISISNQTGQLNLGVRWGVISQEGKSRVSNLQLQIRRYELQTDTEISDIAYQCSTFNSDTTHSFQEN